MHASYGKIQNRLIWLVIYRQNNWSTIAPLSCIIRHLFQVDFHHFSNEILQDGLAIYLALVRSLVEPASVFWHWQEFGAIVADSNGSRSGRGRVWLGNWPDRPDVQNWLVLEIGYRVQSQGTNWTGTGLWNFRTGLDWQILGNMKSWIDPTEVLTENWPRHGCVV